MPSCLFDAIGLKESLPNGRIGGTLQISASHVLFESAAGNVQLPISGLRLELGGANDSLIFFKHPGQPEWSVFTREKKGVLSALQALGNDDLCSQIASIKSISFRATAIGLMAVLCFCAILWGIWSSRHYAAALLADYIPPEWERKLGDVVYHTAIAGKSVADDPIIKEKLDLLVSPLVSALGKTPYEFRFEIIYEESLNAFALPGGMIVIHSGLIEKASAPEEVLGVLGHEIAHVTERHSTKQIISAFGVYFVFDFLVGDIAGILAQASDLAPMLLTQKFSRDFERDADSKGMDYLVKAEIDPSGLGRFFQKMLEQEQESPLGSLQESLSILSTHPATPERIAFLETKAKEYESTSYRSFGSELTDLQEALRKHSSEQENAQD